MGFEPMTSCLLDRRSNQLSYGAKMSSTRWITQYNGEAVTSWLVQTNQWRGIWSFVQEPKPMFLKHFYGTKTLLTFLLFLSENAYAEWLSRVLSLPYSATTHQIPQPKADGMSYSSVYYWWGPQENFRIQKIRDGLTKMMKKISMRNTKSMRKQA